MTEIMEAMYKFWTQFSIPAYLSDQVPSGAELPYITYTVSRAGLTNASLMTAYNWHKAQLGGNLERMEMMDLIAEKIPEEGVCIPIGRGYVIVRRNPAEFQRPWQDPEDRSVIGGRTSCEVYFYLTGKE